MRISEITARFLCSELDLKKPWLNARNVDFQIDKTPRATKTYLKKPTSEWLAVADRIGGRLVRDALWSDDQCTWLGWELLPDTEGQRPGISTLGGDLYDGTAGIAIYLAHLFQSTKDCNYKRTALGALHHASLLSQSPNSGIGAYAGLSGVLYAALTCAIIFKDRHLTVLVTELVTRISKTSASDLQTDIIDGRAGAIRALLAVQEHKFEGKKAALETAIELGNQLLILAERSGQEQSWNTTSFPHQHNLLGYAHGTSGIASALYALYKVTKDQRFLEAATGAIFYEQKHFNQRKRNWPDFRDQNAFEGSTTVSEAPFMCAWCNGAPGTTLALARMIADEASPSLNELFEKALMTTMESISPRATKSQKSFCLCHGVAGNAEILLEVGDLLKRNDLVDAATSAAQAGIKKYDTDVSWPSGVPGGGPSPSLLLGLSGVGCFYLRLHNRSIPSPLSI